MDMKRTNRIIWMTLAAAGITAAAFGGLKSTFGVTITDARQTAKGTISGAHNSADDSQMMQCSYSVSANNVQSMVCVARDAAGLARSCLTQNPLFIEAARSLQDDSILEFRWDANGKCTYMGVAKGSTTESKTPPPAAKRAAS